MPRQEKSPKKKSKKKSPKKSEEEDPAMDEADINRFLQNALDQANAKAEQKFKEQLKEAEDRLTKKFDDEVLEIQRAFEESRGERPSTKDTNLLQEAVVTAVKAVHHQNYTDKKNQIPKRFLELLQEYKFNPSIRGEAQLKLLFSYLTEMQIGPYLKIRHWWEYEFGAWDVGVGPRSTSILKFNPCAWR